jgi:hypothetical protein
MTAGVRYFDTLRYQFLAAQKQALGQRAEGL